MTKFIEIDLGNQIDRYKYTNCTVDDFIDTLSDSMVIDKVIDITEEEFESKKKFELNLNIEDKFEVVHYIVKHSSRESRNQWNQMIRQIKRNEELEKLL